MRTRLPLISVAVPCYAQREFLEEALASIEAQTYPRLEVIIVDDGSPVPVTLPSIRRRFPICLIRHAVNRGLPAARNTGFSQARGEYVFPLDADDQLDPTAIEKLWLLLKHHPRHGFAYPHAQLFGDETGVWETRSYNLAQLLVVNHICAGSLIRRKVWEEVGGYDESMREGFEDWDFWLKLAERGWGGLHVREPLYFYRKSKKSMLAGSLRNYDRLFKRIRQNHPRLYAFPRRLCIAWKWHEKRRTTHAHLLDRIGRFVGTWLPPSVSLPFLRFGRWLLQRGILRIPSPAFSVPPAPLPHTRPVITPGESYPTVFFLIPWLCTGGVETFHVTLIEGLAKRGWRCIIATTLPDTHRHAPRVRHTTSFLYHLDTLCAGEGDREDVLIELLERHRPDLLHLSHTELGYRALPRIRRRLPSLPIAEVLHCEDPFRRDYIDIGEEHASRVTHSITTNRALRSKILERGQRLPDRLSAIPYGTDVVPAPPGDIAHLRGRLAVPPDVTVVSFIARVAHQKRPWIFMKAAARLKKLRPGKFLFLLMGDGPLMRQIRWQHQLLRLGHTVRLLGEQDDVMMILGLSDWLLLPSSFEGLPFVILEAGTAGVPVIAPDVEGIPEVIKHDGGFLFDPRKPEEERIEEIVHTLLKTSEEERKRRGAALKRRVEERYQSDRMADDFDRLYRSLLVRERVFMYDEARKEMTSVGP
jgi:glycosyltransferase involved in cell wall biosynthesis